jgi:F-type H+-transporting ATPase subunit delta
MKYSEVALRYARALYDLSVEGNKQAEFHSALTLLTQALKSDTAAWEFIHSPLVRAADKEAAMQKTLAAVTVPKPVADFVLLLAKKNRLMLLEQIVAAFQGQQDLLSNVTRGTVRSSAELDKKQKEDLQKFIDSHTRKKVHLDFVIDASLVGGVTAQVGSLNFDDTLVSHLKRIKEDLNRSVF